MAKKGKKKKHKLHHPVLVSGGIFLVLLLALTAFWFFGGSTIFIATPSVEKNFHTAKNIYEVDLKDIQEATASEDRIKTLLGKSGNKDIISTLTKQIDDNIAAVEKQNSPLNLSIVVLDEMSIPLTKLWAFSHLEAGTAEITQWRIDAKNYYALANAYYLLVAGITDYKDQVSAQSFDVQNNDEGIASHTKLKDVSTDILSQTAKLFEDTQIELPNVKAYFEKAKQYHEKNISFYQADKARDVATQKTLAKDVSSLKDELAKMDPVSDLSGFESSHLLSLRATLDAEEAKMQKDFTIFQNN